jgi:predicted Zn-dependent protease
VHTERNGAVGVHDVISRACRAVQVDRAEEFYKLALATDPMNPMHCFHYATFLKARRDDEQKSAYYTLHGQQLAKQGFGGEHEAAYEESTFVDGQITQHDEPAPANGPG